MSALNIDITRTSPSAVIPGYARAGDAGLDLVANESAVVSFGSVTTVGTGIAIALPEGYAALVIPRSGLAARHGVTVVNAPGLIDSGYRGEIKVILALLDGATERGFVIEPGDRIAQLVILPYPQIALREVDALDETERGTQGFGSSGIGSHSR